MIRGIFYRLYVTLIAILSSVHMFAYDFEEGNIQYVVTSLEDMTAEVYGLVNANVTSVEIPETTEYKERVLTVNIHWRICFFWK